MCDKIEIIDFEADFFEIAYLNSRAFLKKHLSKDASGIAIALLLGDTSAFNKYKLEHYRVAGIAHIFAVSGLHVGLMGGIFTLLGVAWTIKKGTKAPQAAGKIHTDFERGFIRAEVVSFDVLMECGSMQAAKEKGLVRSEGKEYVMQDGDIVLFRFNV